MPGAGTLLDYGIAINFFGNYRGESGVIGGIADKLNMSLQSLQNLVLGGGIVYSLSKFSRAILSTALSMEANFSGLKATLGDTTKAIEALDWAKHKSLTTPFSVPEMNQAVMTMNQMGLSKTKEMREGVFKAIGDFAAQNNTGFDDIMNRVAQASYGNWQSLMPYNVNQQNIGGRVKEKIKEDPAKYTAQLGGINKAIQIINEGKKGTDEYRMSIVKLIGILGEGGMETRLNTISGAWGKLNSIMGTFMQSMVGYSEVQGTLANAIKTTITEKILKPFMKAHKVIIGGIEEETTTIEQLGRIGERVGQILTAVWGMFDSQIGSVTQSIKGWIDRLDQWFRDYKNNVAPIILFIALVRLEIEDFLSGFYDGFTETFGYFLELIKDVIGGIGKLAKWLGLADDGAKGLGKVLGHVLGAMLGMKALRFATQPFRPLVKGAGLLLGSLDRILFKGRIVKGLMRMGDGNLISGWTLIKGAIGRTTGAVLEFGVALLTTPIGWITLAIAALVLWIGYLITHWDEVQESMQGVSDTALLVISIFMPIIGIPLLLAKHWDKFKVIFSNVWRIIKSVVHIATMFIKDKFTEYIIKPIGKIIGFFRELWANINENYPMIAKAFNFIFAPVLLVIKGIRWLIDHGGNFLSSILDKVKNWTGDIADGLEDTEASMEAGYAKKEKLEKEKQEKEKLYREAAIAPHKNQAGQTVNQKTYTTPNINIYQQPGQSGEDIANKIFEGMRVNANKAGN